MSSHPNQSQEEEGASHGEILIEAARRDNTELLQEVIDSVGNPEKMAVLLNETKTVMGNHIYHEAALKGNYDIIDMLLDQEGFECDPINRIEGDTPLHSVVRYINTIPSTPDSISFSTSLVNMMIEAGSDARIKNKAHLTAYQLLDPRNEAIKKVLQDAVDIEQNKGDYIVEDEDDGELGSASDSDIDAEEWKRENERRAQEKQAMGNGNDI